MSPCETMGSVGHLILAVFTGISTLLGVFLAHRRKQADRERRAFEDAVLDHLGLKYEVRDWPMRKLRRGNGR